MKVLVIQQKMIGDVLTSTIICESLKKTLPNCEVHYMIYPNTLAVVENNPFINKIVLFDPKVHSGFWKLKSFSRGLKKERYDAVIDAYGKWESVLLAYFSAAPIRISFRKWYTSFFFTKTVIQKQLVQGSAIVHRLQLVECLLNKKAETIYPKIYLSEEEINAAKNVLNGHLNSSLKTIMISVLGSDVNKSLPPQHMAATIDIIAKEKVQLLFNYMPNQEKEAQEIYDLCSEESQRKIIFDLKTLNLRAFLGVLSQCDALIGNEGGAVNMAKALNVKTFSLYSPWINKLSWNLLDDDVNHVAIHLNDYHPEIYNDKHPKEFKTQSEALYSKLVPELYREVLEIFVKRIVT